MKRSDISDRMVLDAYAASSSIAHLFWPDELLEMATKAPTKLVYSAMERAVDHGLIDYGCTMRSGWITEKGLALMSKGGET